MSCFSMLYIPRFIFFSFDTVVLVTFFPTTRVDHVRAMPSHGKHVPVVEVCLASRMLEQPKDLFDHMWKTLENTLGHWTDVQIEDERNPAFPHTKNRNLLFVKLTSICPKGRLTSSQKPNGK